MQGLAVDDAAWASPWRTRAVGDKAALSLGLVLCALLLPPWPGALIVTVVALGAAVGAARTPLRPVLRALTAPAAFIALGAVSVAVTVTATPDWSVGVTADSARRALEVSGHAIAGTSAVLLLAVTTPMIDILTGLRRLRVPQACIDVAAVMYRFLFVLLSSVRTIRQSQTARLGYSSPRRSLHSAGLLTAAVLIKSWDRASRLEAGLSGREFGDAVSADPVDRQRSSPSFLVTVVAVLGAVVALSLLGHRA
ncbi:cobalt ECF transporter T component CbiQ [Rhodococcus sp. MEB041]|uniref:cobalt ECF transporter T component CbiQ n=1 Tax=Rhodococcus sp. MEB041 TaxID=3040323 RepID=UPI00254E261A|nr:cobalt ECF transporter T component CbiQ [Rhodococcus sp. MEB041]